ncbi:MAG: hypothetical protein OSA24_01695 [Longimicrobiales bacterium]|nr:hypothetical protein [Longimicrobiales bacterium]
MITKWKFSQISTVRWTIKGMVAVGGTFLTIGIIKSVFFSGGPPFLQYLNPIGLMTVIGATVGGLVGPLVGKAMQNIRS